MIASSLAVALTGVLYGVAAFALAFALGRVRPPPARRRRSIDAYQIKLMSVTLCSVAVGCFTATRTLTLLQMASTALVVAALAGTIGASRTVSRELLLCVCTIAAAFVLFSAAVDAMWPAVFATMFVALPFLLTALFVADRGASFVDAAVAAIAGASIGITGAFFALFVACLCALAGSRSGSAPRDTPHLAPYMAAFTLVGILLNMSVLS